LGRWVCVDYGTKRIGLALADLGHAIASPAGTLSGTGNAPDDARRIIDWARQHEALGIVLGLPLNMDGSEGTQAKLTRELAAELGRQAPLPVRLWDERLSSWQADQNLTAAGVRRSRRKSLRDSLAAQVVLQSFLDALQSGETGPTPTT
jgi:putative Holliday junction resolvase